MRCCTSEQLPYLHQLAGEFAVCDRWFASLPGHTWPNRVFVHAATSGGMDMEPDEAVIARWELVWRDGLELANGTIYDRLRDAGLNYRLYHDDEPFPYLPPMVSSLKGVSILDIDDLDDLESDLADPDFRDIRYIHIEPSYDVLGVHGEYEGEYSNGNSQHPLGDVRKGDQLIKRVYETIRNSPVWEQSLLIITWDEHGGFYDHVAPPAAVPPGEPPARGHRQRAPVRLRPARREGPRSGHLTADPEEPDRPPHLRPRLRTDHDRAAARTRRAHRARPPGQLASPAPPTRAGAHRHTGQAQHPHRIPGAAAPQAHHAAHTERAKALDRRRPGRRLPLRRLHAGHRALAAEPARRHPRPRRGNPHTSTGLRLHARRRRPGRRRQKDPGRPDARFDRQLTARPGLPSERACAWIDRWSTRPRALSRSRSRSLTRRAA